MAEMFIDGRPAPADRLDRLEIRDPARQRLVGDTPIADAAAVDDAVRSATDAFAEWKRVPTAERGEVLFRAAAAVRDHIDELVPVLTDEQGKTHRDARIELNKFVHTLEHHAGLSKNLRGESMAMLDRGTTGMVLRRPLGVVGAIVPWNFPTTLLGNKLAPALICGNTVVAKPDEGTPLTTLRVAEIMHQAGLPAGVFNVVTGTGEVTGDALVRHPGVAKIAFTGSTPIGKHVMAVAADRVARVTLELGGSDPLIILDDADVDAAISAASMGRFYNCGQACLATKRVYADASIADRVIEGLAAKARKLTIGPGDEAGNHLGPMFDQQGRDTLQAQLDDAVSSGGEIVAGGELPADDRLADGWFFAPTVVAQPGHDSRVVTEETFGPLLPVWSVDGLDEAIARANASPFALGSAIWTADLASAQHAIEELRAGYTWVNSRTKVYDELPFGGLGESGYGKEHGMEAFHYYTEEKSVVIRS